MTRPPAPGDVVGPVRATTIAHGGHVVARLDERVIFVRHALPGELVTVRLTETSHARFWLGDAVQVLEASPDRVPAPCPVAGECGGCDFQHVSASAQRRLKAEVIDEQLRRLAGLDLDLDLDRLVEPADPAHPDDLLGWRTRMRYRVSQGRPAMMRHHSNELVVLPDAGCAIAHRDIDPARVAEAARGARRGVDAVVSADDVLYLVDDGPSPAPAITQRVGPLAYELSGAGFWQVHPRAAQVLVEAVLAALDPLPGETVWDLYCGVGLFAAQLSRRGMSCVGVESDRGAVTHARRNAPGVSFHAAPVERALPRLPDPDLVVLDPPRKGAGARVCLAITDRKPRAVAYVACDPAALARDLRTFAAAGYRLTGLRAFDLFPMTHHVECVALLEPEARVPASGTP